MTRLPLVFLALSLLVACRNGAVPPPPPSVACAFSETNAITAGAQLVSPGHWMERASDDGAVLRPMAGGDPSRFTFPEGASLILAATPTAIVVAQPDRMRAWAAWPDGTSTPLPFSALGGRISAKAIGGDAIAAWSSAASVGALVQDQTIREVPVPAALDRLPITGTSEWLTITADSLDVFAQSFPVVANQVASIQTAELSWGPTVAWVTAPGNGQPTLHAIHEAAAHGKSSHLLPAASLGMWLFESGLGPAALVASADVSIIYALNAPRTLPDTLPFRVRELMTVDGTTYVVTHDGRSGHLNCTENSGP